MLSQEGDGPVQIQPPPPSDWQLWVPGHTPPQVAPASWHGGNVVVVVQKVDWHSHPIDPQKPVTVWHACPGGHVPSAQNEGPAPLQGGGGPTQAHPPPPASQVWVVGHTPPQLVPNSWHGGKVVVLVQVEFVVLVVVVVAQPLVAHASQQLE